MINKITLIGVLALTTLIMTGCAGKNVPVNSTVNQITSDPNKAYVVFTTFSWPIMSIKAKVLKYDPETYEAFYLGTFEELEQYIDEVSPGEHTYLLEADGLEKIVQLHLQSGEVAYISSIDGSRLSESRKNLIESLRKSQCNEYALKRYGFKEKEATWSSDLLTIDIKCKGNSISTIKDKRFLTFDDIAEANIVKTPKEDLDEFNKKLNKNHKMAENYKKKIHELEKFHVDLHKNISMKYQSAVRAVDLYSIDVLKSTNNENAYQYDTIRLDPSSNTSSQFNDLNNGIASYLEKIDMKNGKGVIIKYDVVNYAEGSQAGRYFSMSYGGMLKDKSSIELLVKFVDSESGKTIGEIEYNSFLPGGLLGGGGFLDDAAEYIVEYAKMNYLK